MTYFTKKNIRIFSIKIETSDLTYAFIMEINHVDAGRTIQPLYHSYASIVKHYWERLLFIYL